MKAIICIILAIIYIRYLLKKYKLQLYFLGVFLYHYYLQRHFI
jgi:hypothetical protein